jgi:hypothetical protein
MTFNRLHGVIAQKIELSISTAVENLKSYRMEIKSFNREVQFLFKMG